MYFKPVNLELRRFDFSSNVQPKRWIRNWVFGTSNILTTISVELDCKPLVFRTQIIWFNRIHSLKYLRSATFGSKDIVIRKSEFVAKTQFLCLQSDWFLAKNSNFVIPICLQSDDINLWYFKLFWCTDNTEFKV